MTTRYLTTDPITTTPIAPGVGAVVVFLGVVRGDQDSGRRVTALTYEAYAEMAERQIHQLVAAAHLQWPLDAVRIEHRLGTIAVHEVSVMIVVTAQHRDEAYAASRFLMDGIKHQTPIWKREHYDDGTSQWVGCVGSGPVDTTHAELSRSVRAHS